MALQDRKLGTYADNVKSLSDYPSDDGVTAEQLKAIFDGRTDKEVKNAINGVINDLTVSSGAGEIRTTSGKSVQDELNLKAVKSSPVVNNKLIVQTGEASGEKPTAPYLSVFPISRGACIRYGEGDVMTPTFKITESGLIYNQDGYDYKVYAENNKPQKSDVGLENVDNTSDVNKPVSIAAQAALDAKVDKVSGKGLSTNDYTTAEKNKLAGMESGATNTVVDASLSSTSTNPVQNKTVQAALDTKVDKVSGKGLSTNDYTTEEKSKLSGVEDGATNTVVDTALSSTSENPVQNKVVSLALQNKANFENPGFIGDMSVQGGSATSFSPKLTVSVDDSRASISYESAINPLPEKIIFGEAGRLAYYAGGSEYNVYTEKNPPTIEVDSALSSTSENPVQNKAVKSAIDDKADKTSVNELKEDLADLAPAGANVGQLFRVAAISEDGKYTMEPVDMLDVKVNGKSVVQDGVADVPVASGNSFGLVRCRSTYGIAERSSHAGIPSELGILQLTPASNNEISDRYSDFKPITPAKVDYAVKAAMCDGKGAAWTDAERIAALLRLGCTVDENGFVKWGASE